MNNKQRKKIQMPSGTGTGWDSQRTAEYTVETLYKYNASLPSKLSGSPAM